MSKRVAFEIILGTYEEFLLGYYFLADGGDIVQSFAAHDHSGSVRTVAHAGNYVASGAADDRICVYDLKTRKEHCMLTQHDSTVTAVRFTADRSHVVSASSDGVLAIVRTGNWQLEKLWPKAHKGAAILDVAVHGTGKMALTLGADGTLRTWNLVTGRQAYAVNLLSKSRDARSLEGVRWSPDGVHFALHGGRYVEVWSTETGGLVHAFEQQEKVASCAWKDEDTVMVGLEDGNIVEVCVESKRTTAIVAHDARVKAISVYEDYIVSASSSGEFKVWTKEFEEVAKHSAGCRITCLCVVPPVNVKLEDGAKSSETITVRASPQKRPRTKVVVEVEESEEEEVPKVVSAKEKKKLKKKKKTPEIAEPKTKKAKKEELDESKPKVVKKLKKKAGKRIKT